MIFFVRNTILTFFILSIFALPAKSQILKKSDVSHPFLLLNKYLNANSIKYHYHLKMKFFDKEEPFTFESNVVLIRDNADTIHHGKFLYNRIDSLNDFQRYYDGKSLHLINHKTQEITVYDSDFPISGSIDSYAINTSFLNISAFKKSIKENRTSYRDTILNNTKYLLLKVYFPDEEDYVEMSKTYWINSQDSIIERATAFARYFDQTQTVEWELSNVRFNTFSTKKLKRLVRPFFSKYKIKDYQPTIHIPLKIGDTFPKIHGTVYPDSTKFIPDTTILKVVDFWYTSCDPCIKSIPSLNDIALKYEGQVQVLGLNPIDLEKDSYQKITAFTKRTPIDYPVIQISRELATEAKVVSFPSLFLIDKYNKILYTKVGFDEDGFNELVKVLDREINKKP